MKRTNTIYKIILSVTFLAWILFPLLTDSFSFYSESSVSKRENRVLARRPVFDVNLLDPYPSAYNAFYSDHFVFRQLLLKAHSLLSFYYFDRSPVPDQVDIGKKGWLYLAMGDRDVYQGKKNLTSYQVYKLVRELHNRSVYYKRRGIHFYFCLAPMKQEIYPEYLPANYLRSPTGTQTDKLIAAIRRDTLIPFIDLKSVLLNSKKLGQSYPKTDHHWNYLGAFYVYSAIIQRIKEDFPIVVPLTRKDIVFDKKIKSTGSLANMIGFADELQEDSFLPRILHEKSKPLPKAGYPPPYWFGVKDQYEVVWGVPDPRLPRLFVIRDSYFTYPMIYFKENFSKSVMIWDAWLYGPNKDLIAREKPDIVLMMIYEQNIIHLLTLPVQ